MTWIKGMTEEQNRKQFEIEREFYKEHGVSITELEIACKSRQKKIDQDFTDMFFCVSNGIEWDFENNCKADAAN